MSSVQLERKGRVAVIRLNEPETMNALSGGIKAVLETEVPRLLDDPAIGALVFTGSGKAFCAGGDIRSMREVTPIGTRARLQRNYTWAQRLLTAEKPVVMALNGVAAGAGFALAMLGDIVYASREARFKAGFPGIAAVPDVGLAYTLPRAVGQLRAREILLSNRMVGMEEALAIGLVNRVLGPAELLDAALETATALAEGPAIALGLTKTLVRRAFDDTLERFLEDEAKAQAIAFSSEDFREGVAAFMEKRKPVFTGR
ncbi:MAG: enoyl-CoA hydratase/isomerase family protein [Alphaproteobacteria bacterium]|nr:enoyl-CoA hydratase/isomerase family protein [Alphaproteobacteria bacterium]